MKPTWKSGNLVRLGSDGLLLSVVGYDSVGSVICELADSNEPRDRIYIAPALLHAIEPDATASSAG